MGDLLSGDLGTQILPLVYMAVGMALNFVWNKAKELAAASPNKIDDKVIELIQNTVGTTVRDELNKPKQ